MSTTDRILASLAIAAALTFCAYAFSASPTAHASAPNGLMATVATSSSVSVTSTASLVVATSSCSARIISTGTSAILMTFSDNQGLSPTGVYGVFQPGSTTVAYDSGQYGCGAVRVFSYTTGPISVTETR